MTPSGRIGVVDIVAVIEDVDRVGQDSVAVVQIEAGVVVDGRPADVVS